MGAEFPPVIIDGSNCIPNPDQDLQTPAMSMRASTGAVAAAKLDPAAVAGLYLIRNNLLHHEGDFRLNDVELVCGDDPSPAATAGKEACVRLSNATINDHGAGLCRVGLPSAAKVSAIRLKGRQELLRYGQDFHNFLLLLRPKQ